MNVTELILLLMEIPGVGGKTIETVLRRNATAGRSPNEFIALSASALQDEYGLREDVSEKLSKISSPELRRAETDFEWMSRRDVALITVLDASYPIRLTNRLDDPPAALFSYGSGHLLDGPLLAVANSNGANEHSLAAGDRSVESAVQRGWSVVTGHNRVQYQRPALAARRNEGRVCYVLDRGLIHGFGGDLTRELFPAARIWGPAYDPHTDLTLSPFGLRDHGIASNNRRRDTLVFALADVIFAGEVRAGGQMESECLAALKGGRPVYLISSEPNQALIYAGASRLDVSSADLLDGALSHSPTRK